MTRNKKDKTDEAIAIFQQNNGFMRAMEAIRSGIHRRTLYSMRDVGILVQVSRGLYRLSDLPPLGTPDLVTVSRKSPDSVICLISALDYHGITTQIPHEVHVAIIRDGMRPPKLEWPPIRIFKFSKSAFLEGIEMQTIDDIVVRIYSPEKTLADCFKFRNKIGIDVAIEAMSLYKKQKDIKPSEIIHYARVCRVENVMRPYLEALL